MFRILRVDNRLIHGQVAFSLVSAFKITRIIAANDKYATNQMLKMTLQFGKPAGVELKIMKVEEAIEYINSDVDNLETTMVVAIDIEDAEKIVTSTQYQGDVCIGGVIEGKDKKFVYSQVFLSTSEIELIKEMLNVGANVYAQDVPANKALSAKDIIEKY